MIKRTSKPFRYYTRDRLISIGKKYESSKDWIENDYNSYASAISKYTSKDKGIFGHLKRRDYPITKWTKENILKDALKYSYQVD